MTLKLRTRYQTFQVCAALLVLVGACGDESKSRSNEQRIHPTLPQTWAPQGRFPSASAAWREPDRPSRSRRGRSRNRRQRPVDHGLPAQEPVKPEPVGPKAALQTGNGHDPMCWTAKDLAHPTCQNNACTKVSDCCDIEILGCTERTCSQPSPVDPVLKSCKYSLLPGSAACTCMPGACSSDGKQVCACSRVETGLKDDKDKTIWRIVASAFQACPAEFPTCNATERRCCALNMGEKCGCGGMGKRDCDGKCIGGDCAGKCTGEGICYEVSPRRTGPDAETASQTPQGPAQVSERS